MPKLLYVYPPKMQGMGHFWG